MATARINKRSVDAALAQTKDRYLWDDQLRGFGLKITPTGNKIYLIQYNLHGRNGRTSRVKVGPHGVLTAEQARTEAKKLLGDVAARRDPAESRAKAKAQRTLGSAVALFLDEYVDAKLKPSTAEEYRRLMRLHLAERLRSRPLGAIARADIATLHLKLRDKPYQANRLLAVLSKFFNWAKMQDLRSDASNPCRHIKKYRERKRERFLTECELGRLGQALVNAETEGLASPWVIAAIWLLILTGARHSEIRKLLWSEVDLSRRRLRLRESKTNEKTIYLSDAAVEILASIPRLDDNPHVICGEKIGACLVNLQKPWRRIRQMADLDDVRIHDLRHSFASFAAARGHSLQAIGALLGHAQTSTTARYAHLTENGVARTNDDVCALIAARMKHSG
jgi:integrase